MAQFTRPEATITNQGYVNQANSGSFLYQSLDEVTASDVDYIESPVDANGSVYVTRLSDALDPLSAVNHVVRYRYRKVGPAAVNLAVELRQGYVSEASRGTLIASWSHGGISNTSVTAGQALSAAEANAITDYTQLHLRFSSTITPLSSSSTFGPVLGAAAVRAGAGPRTVANPGGGVSFNSGTNIQTLIDSNAANTVFVASATGAYANFRGISVNGKHPKFYFPGAAASYSITGSGAATQLGLNVTSGGIEVYGGTWSQYGNSTAAAGYSAPMVLRGTSIVEDAVFTLNHVALSVDTTGEPVGSSYRVAHCSAVANVRYGFNGAGAMTFEYNIIDNNNTGRLEFGWNSGGTKFLHTDGMVCRYNWVKNNYGFGLWWDGYNMNLQCNDNVTENNNSSGIFYEISYGGTVIEHNYSFNDGKGDAAAAPGSGGLNPPYGNDAILISCSPSDATGSVPPAGPNTTSEVRYNDIDTSGGGGGIGLLDHGGHPSGLRTRNWSVHHNRVYTRGPAVNGLARSGLFDPYNLNLITLAGANNHFDYNEYHVASVGGAYYDADGSKTFTTFRTAGHEANGSEVVI
jgi:hypothetical protein